jgi:hypothetical protein
MQRGATHILFIRISFKLKSFNDVRRTLGARRVFDSVWPDVRRWADIEGDRHGDESQRHNWNDWRDHHDMPATA